MSSWLGQLVLRTRSLLLIVLLALAVLLSMGRLDQAPVAATPYPKPVPRPAQGVFLVANETMPDPRFHHSVILLLEHGEEGTLGVIVNRPSEILLADAVPDLENAERGEHWLFFGGPVAMNALMVLIRSQDPPPQARPVLADIYLSAERSVLERLLGNDQPPERMRIYFGHAGWAPGQLDAELARGSWELFQADPERVFNDDPDALWEHFMGEGRRIMVRGTPASTERAVML